MSTKSVKTPTQQLAERRGDIELQGVDSGSNEVVQRAEVNDESNTLTRRNLFQIIAAGFSFFFAGTNDGSLGALTPYILRTYNVGTQYVALMYGGSLQLFKALWLICSSYAANFAGWLFAAVTNSHISGYLELGSVLVCAFRTQPGFARD